MKKAIIFDLDDTLVYLDFKTMDCHDDFLNMLNIDLALKKEIISEMMIFFKGFNNYFKDRKVTLDETKEFMMSVCPFIDKYKLVVDEVLRALFDATIGAAKEIEGTKEVLDYLKTKGYKLLILTNWFEYVQIGKLKLTDLYNYFNKIICIDNGYLKPSLNVLNDILKEYKKDECIIIGNNYEEDILLGANNNIDTVWVSQKDDDDKKATYVINSLKELKKIL